jgi:simple sugar transport system ATP-binding protein
MAIAEAVAKTDSPALELLHISKRFGSQVALDDVSLSVRAGEILALVGENGAGKSTLMNVAYGLYRADAGEVKLFGEQVRLRNPSDALARGVGMVHQHFMLVPPLSVAENVVLGREPRRLGVFDRGAANRSVREAALQLGFPLDPEAQIKELSVGQQQRVEIVKALFGGAKVLILDEPTAVLTPQEALELQVIAQRLKAQGHTLIFISHKLKEVLAIADRIAVMARGRLVDVLDAKATTADALADKMLGNRQETESGSAHTSGAHWGTFRPELRRPARAIGDVKLELKSAQCDDDRGLPALRGIDLVLHAGEILGVAGVAGNGQGELAEVLTGLRPLRSGTLLLEGSPLPADPGEARARGVVHIPEDRQRRGLCLDMSVAENVALGRQRRAPFANGLRIDERGRRERANQVIEAFEVRPADPDARVRDLSGGNQQKVILGRELSDGPTVVVAVQPTRGLDVGAISRVHEQLFAARDKGAAVLLISLDLDELRALADRIAVLFGGRVVAVSPGETVSEEQLGRWMVGQS